MRGSRAVGDTAKATESDFGLGAGAEEPSGVWGVERANGCRGNPGEPSWPRSRLGGTALTSWRLPEPTILRSLRWCAADDRIHEA
jgi:hypothetical protein